MVAATDAGVLILGESGVGKELVARAIHQRSPRARKPLVKVNCGSIPHELFESEFFGHAKGSFTGAIRDRVGRFQLADGGTLFLDEVGEIPLDLQSKLLRVLQEGEFERVGDELTRRVNVRVVAATNRDLRDEVKAGRFRLDLFYRLGVFPVEVPPLRDRREDIPELAASFVRQACQRFHVPEPRLSARELERAQGYHWPGNVRELQNVIERAVILAQGGPLLLDLPQKERPTLPATPIPTEVIPEDEWRRRERANLQAALVKSGHKVSGPGGAAELLGLNPATLTSRLKALGLGKRL
jgi:transcriptional regulator with GAF, ATPase, and Fis domain